MKLTLNKTSGTKSGFFILPLTLVPRNYFNNASAFYALNDHKPELDKHVFVLFKKEQLECYQLSRFQTFETYVDHEYIGEFVLITFAVHKDFHKDHKRFLKGKYSKFSDEAKNAIAKHIAFRIKNANGKLVDSRIAKILNPLNQDRADLAEILGVRYDELEENCEIMSSPDLEVETFNINRFYKLFE